MKAGVNTLEEEEEELEDVQEEELENEEELLTAVALV